MVRTPKANLKICRREYPESAINGFDGVRAQSTMPESSVNMPTPQNTKDKAEVLHSAEAKEREKARMETRKVTKEK